MFKLACWILLTCDVLPCVNWRDAGTPHFPSSVHFIIGSFPDLFGTGVGLAVQQWCIQHNWLLLWALGKNGDTKTRQDRRLTSRLQDQQLQRGHVALTASGSASPRKFEGNHRIIDPVVAAAVARGKGGGRTTISPQALAAFTPVRKTFSASQHDIAVCFSASNLPEASRVSERSYKYGPLHYALRAH